ncbi:hypothetical protein [Natrinema salifodinae]|uniref:Uncharacterized protein n=1 Tax=Natrinema salifodinae TaxID=1202768 RepID=A0A1I0QIQ1_9EURY|nr:hypothetical protein [Natrinema salifodinae]SEW26885.1 hypothetical protein SAMN05216285_3623 [Natrinema salifodinae]
MATPYREPGREPTESAREDAADTMWGIREGTGIAIASIFGLVVLVVGLMLVSGLVAASTTTVVTLGVTVGVVLAAIGLAALARWSWTGR